LRTCAGLPLRSGAEIASHRLNFVVVGALFHIVERAPSQVIDRNELAQPGKPLQKERWSGVVDSVGSHTLANACAQTRYRGVVTACGLAQGMDFPSSVAPFILRGISLLGIDSVMAPHAVREPAWNRLARDLDLSNLDRISTLVGLEGALSAAQDIVAGKIRGRVVVDVNR